MHYQKNVRRAASALILAAALPAWVFAVGRAESTKSRTTLSLAVFIPGVVSGSPIYEELAAGVQTAASAREGVSVKIVEGGFNQAEWETQLMSLAATGVYDLIISSNPAIPTLCSAVAARFPAQKFLLFDGDLAGNTQIYTLRYNQREQAYLAGHLAALATLNGLSGANAAKKIGLIAGQEYPAMNDIILSAYLEGARSVDPEIQVDFRVVGNWYDAVRGAELAGAMIRDGVDVIMPISGGANQGVVQAAAEAGVYIVWFDVNGYAVKPGTVIGSAVLRQAKAATDRTTRWLNGALPFGQAELVGVADGYVDFVEDDPLYIQTVPEGIRRRQSELLARLKSGALVLKPGLKPGR